MRSPSPSYEQLRERLAVAEETLRAIRAGEVDALVVQTEAGERLFTLEGADAFYRVLVEEMPLGVAGLHASGTILYANARLAQMLGCRWSGSSAPASQTFCPNRTPRLSALAGA
jgi:PAS domain-containing protein